jgi:hypothetical protein
MANSCCQAQAEAMAALIRRTLTRTSAPILRSFSRIVPHVAVGELGMREPDPTQRAEQDISERGKPQAYLVGPHSCRRGAVGEQIELAVLDPVLHLAARNRSFRRDAVPRPTRA